jgi:serine-type D-Ala-D-Ala carboxypeptidase (penicillin-binding protein 5/6)
MFLRPTIAIFSLLLSIFVFAEKPALSVLTPTAPEIAAKAYILVDANTGYVISENNADERLEPASLTKMMTSYIAEYEIAKGTVSPDDLTTVSENAWARKFPGSSLMFLQVDTQVSVGDLMKGVIISSGNDATVALAEHISGSVDAFTDVMNRHSERLGLKGTHFMNPHGLPDPEHYTTARDMAILARAIILDYPEQYKTYAEKSFMYNNIEQPNRNLLLWSDSTVDGLKTGHTQGAGFCLVASAKRDDMRLISVVMGTASEKARAAETQKLFAYGFRYFQTMKLFAKDQQVVDVRIWGGKQDQLKLSLKDDVWVTVLRTQKEAVKSEQTLNKYIKAPVKAGDKLGELVVQLGNGKVLKQDLVASADVAEAGFFGRLWDMLQLFIFKLAED